MTHITSFLSDDRIIYVAKLADVREGFVTLFKVAGRPSCSRA